MRIKLKLVTLAAILLQGFVAMGATHEIYLSPSGDDRNQGNKNSPLATLNEALARAIALQDDSSIDAFVINLAKEGNQRITAFYTTCLF